jgi:hypothetical protein
MCNWLKYQGRELAERLDSATAAPRHLRPRSYFVSKSSVTRPFPLCGLHFILGTFLVAIAFAGCSKSPAPLANQTPVVGSPTNGEPWFEEIAAQAGVNFRFSTGHQPGRYYMPEVKGGGLGLLDYDKDGYLDIFCVQAGAIDPAVTNRPVHKLFRNLGNLKFQDVTDQAGIIDNGSYGVGCACGDYNNDGFPDIYVTALGTNVLYRNNGNGTFTDVTQAAGADHAGWGASSAFFDYDGDGNLDLIIANYIKWSREAEVECYSRAGQRDYCSPLNYKAPSMATLYHNRGNGTFEDVSLAAGLDKAYGYGLGVVCADFNQDGRPDIYMANDATPNQLWINQGNGHFTDEALTRGCAVNSFGMAEAGMGIAVADLFDRGQFDLFITHLVGEGNRLFVNSNGYFTDFITPKGPGAPSLPYTGFGDAFEDFDNDGYLDLFIANGRVKRGQVDLDPNDPYAEPNNLLRGLGDGQFEEVFPQGGTSPVLLASSRGAGFGDLDNDGGIDIVISNRDGPTHILHNLIGRRNHWVTFKVLDSRGLEAIGALLRLEAGGRRQWRQVQPNQSYCSSNDPRVHYGLGKVTQVDKVVVRWPKGTEETFGPFEANRIYELREGKSGR